jgi:RNA polymerase sigma factor (sigma-70 family)
MPNGQLRTVVQFIRQIAVRGHLVGLSDRQLLQRFIDQRDEDAFALLVERHGPLVMSVCKRSLANIHDSEDAFQATFLVLVRRARSIVKRESVGSWLYGVAYRIAARARKEAVSRRARERRAEPKPAPDLLNEVIRQDVRSMLDEAVLRLPARCRVPFVLCYMEGETNEEAARILGCPVGTVHSRLARARELLRKSLSRRGLALSAALVSTMLSQRPVSAAVAKSLIEITAGAAARIALGESASAAVGVKIAALVEGALKTMWLNKLKLATLMILSVSCLGLGAGLIAHSAYAQKVNQPANHSLSAGESRQKTPPPPTDGVLHEAEAAPGYSWAVLPHDRRGSPWTITWRILPPRNGKRDDFASIICFEEEDKEGGLVLTLAHPPTTSKARLLDYRPVAFDADHRRYPLQKSFGGEGAEFAMYRHYLDPKDLPKKKVAYLGVEVLTTEGEQRLVRQTYERAKKEGREVLPPPEVGKAYNFLLTTTEGKKLRSSELRGKVILIDCWATWCSPCVALLPDIKKIYDKNHKNGLEVIGINFDSSAETALKKVRELKLPWPQVNVPSDETSRHYWHYSAGIGSLPQLFLIDRNGILRADNSQSLEEAVAKLLAEKSSN